MAFLIFSQDDKEIGRWQLAGPTVIGRAPDCVVSLHDILLSRHHCRIQPTSGAWEVVDLGSKNGTRIAGERVQRQGLRDGDTLTIGLTSVRFHVGQLLANSPGVARLRQRRPADPNAALANTIAGMNAFAAEDDAKTVEQFQRKHNFPTPRPMPKDPLAYEREDIYSMLTEIASSSWDSIYANASRPRRLLPPEPEQIDSKCTQPMRRRPSRPGHEWDLQVRTSRAATRQPPPPRRNPMRRFVSSVSRRLESIRCWVAPSGSIKLL